MRLTKFKIQRIGYLVLGALFFVAGCTPNNTLHQYSFNTAIINYTATGSSDGTVKLTIKGDTSVREAHVVFHKTTGDEKQDNLTIDNGKTITSIDLNKKIGSTTVNPDYEILNKLDPSQRQEYLKKSAIGYAPDDALTQLTQELKLVGHTKIADQRCEIYITVGFGQTCLWNAIPLRTTIALLNLHSDTVATSVVIDPNVDDKIFQIPPDIKFTNNLP